MRLWDCFTTALRALTGNKLRSVLTMLGILIGVAAVISVVSLGRTQEAMTHEAFASLGSNLIYVMPGASSHSGMGGTMGTALTLTMEDAEAIASNAHSVAAVAPVAQLTAQIAAGRENAGVTVAGITPEYQWVNNLTIAQGSFITERDYKAKSRVVVLGSQLAETLFGQQFDPTGQSVRVNGRKFIVIGVLESKGSTFGFEDLTAYAPLSTIQSTLAAQQITSLGHSVQVISVRAGSEDEIESAEEEITSILRQRHRIREGQEDDFTVMSMSSVSRIADQILGIVQLVLAAIAGISLLVGGIGIMNIMLVSVTERTREIGLRKAIGAKRRDILTQFLTEAATLSLCGGAIGVGLGWLLVKIASIVAANMGFPIPTMLPGDVIALAVGVSIFIGLVSGIYPAFRGARLDPIASLRHE
ncbi:MAG: ABC transporter permease [Dehalococcoidia bacterium]|nr:ABC transporter permease [Dehalococcoidia bacterium]